MDGALSRMKIITVIMDHYMNRNIHTCVVKY
jgi:hypothetical protein